MRPDSLPILWRYINLLLTYLLTYLIPGQGVHPDNVVRDGYDGCWKNLHDNGRFVHIVHLILNRTELIIRRISGKSLQSVSITNHLSRYHSSFFIVIIVLLLLLSLPLFALVSCFVSQMCYSSIRLLSCKCGIKLSVSVSVGLMGLRRCMVYSAV